MLLKFCKKKWRQVKNLKKKEISIKKTPADFPKPFTGTGSALTYFKNQQNNNTMENGVFTLNLADFSVKNLLPYYLKYVIKTMENGEYKRTDKEVANDLNISIDKARRVKNLSVDREYLINKIKSCRVFVVQRNKINKYLMEGC
jgi:hypothetical protein